MSAQLKALEFLASFYTDPPLPDQIGDCTSIFRRGAINTDYMG